MARTQILVHKGRPRTRISALFRRRTQPEFSFACGAGLPPYYDYASNDEVLSELELRFSGNDQEILCALGNFCHNETPDKESLSSPALLNCTKLTARFSKPSRQCTRGFVLCAD